jgi:RimJ/RimL family protein N-acetyltransferase
VIRKSDNAPIGRCGLAFLEVDPAPDDGGEPYGYFSIGEAPPGKKTVLERELGYTFAREVWGKGFAREAVAAVFDYAVKTLKTDRVLSLIHQENERSKRLASHFGATRVSALRAFGRPFAFDIYLWPIPPAGDKISP